MGETVMVDSISDADFVIGGEEVAVEEGGGGANDADANADAVAAAPRLEEAVAGQEGKTNPKLFFFSCYFVTQSYHKTYTSNILTILLVRISIDVCYPYFVQSWTIYVLVTFYWSTEFTIPSFLFQVNR